MLLSATHEKILVDNPVVKQALSLMHKRPGKCLIYIHNSTLHACLAEAAPNDF